VRTAHPHARVVRRQLRGLAVVEESIVRHLHHLVRLPKAVPRAHVPRVGVDGAPVRVDRAAVALELEELVADEAPRVEARGVELERALEVDDRLQARACGTDASASPLRL
jgi:hypothetical protein